MSHWHRVSQGLLAQAEPTDQRAIAFAILALQVIEQLAALIDHGQQAAARVVILDVFFEVTSKVIDTCSQQSYLNFGRPGVTCSALKIGHDLRSLRNIDRHVKLSFVSNDAAPV